VKLWRRRVLGKIGWRILPGVNARFSALDLQPVSLESQALMSSTNTVLCEELLAVRYERHETTASSSWARCRCSTHTICNEGQCRLPVNLVRAALHHVGRREYASLATHLWNLQLWAVRLPT